MLWFYVTLGGAVLIVAIILVVLFFRKLWYVVAENSLILQNNNKKLFALSEFLGLTGVKKKRQDTSSTSHQTRTPTG